MDYHNETRLQVGATYFVTTNIDVSDGLFNEAMGVLKKIDFGTLSTTNARVPTIAWIEFDSKNVGFSKRRTYHASHLRHDVPDNWVPIERVSKELSKSFVYKGLKLLRNQLPLLGANAITIAKSQGSSMPLVVVSVKNRLSRDHLYVACSRATSLNGLYIEGNFTAPDYPGDNDDVSEEIRILKQKPVDMSLRFLTDISNVNKLYFHNVEDFRCYREDIIADPNIVSADVIAFVEPRIQAGDSWIPGFNCVTSGYCSAAATGQRNSAGHLVYCRNGTSASNIEVRNNWSQRYGFTIVKLFFRETVIVVCYKHPGCSADDFMAQLAAQLSPEIGKPLIVVGDLNMDLLRLNQRLKSFFARFGCESKLPETEPTTEYGTRLDVCFSSIGSVSATTYETYYSFHEGLCITWE